jgi:hypothetical protein
MNTKITRSIITRSITMAVLFCKLDKKRWEKFVERAKKNQQNQQK